MDQVENYYSVLGITKASTDMEVRLAYNVLAESLRAKATPDSQALDQQRMALLDLALHTLLSPEKKKRHDEKLDWFVAKARLQADRAREAAIRLKQAQEDAQYASRAALAAAQAAAQDAAKLAEVQAQRQAELARVEVEASERFRKLREERLPFLDTAPPLQQDDDHPTLPFEPEPPAINPEAANQYLRSVGKKIAMGSVVLVAFFSMAYWWLSPVTPKPAPLSMQPLTGAVAAAAAPTSQPQCAPANANVPCEAEALKPNNATEIGPAAKTGNAPPAPPAAAKSTKADSAKAAELLQYQKVLRRVEQEHPELNPDRPGHRDDLMAFVAARVKVHLQAGYPRSKALEIAVRDLETQEQAKRMLEKHRTKDQPQPQAAPVLDKGEHPGYDPKCRWVTPEQWSCK